MADPLSLAASTIAVIGAAGSIAKAIHAIKTNLEEAKSLLCLVGNEVTDLQRVLVLCQRAAEQFESSTAQFVTGSQSSSAANITVGVKRLVIQAKVLLKRLDEKVQSCTTQRSSGTASDDGNIKIKLEKRKWLKEKGEICKLREEISSIRRTLDTLLSSIPLSGFSNLQMQVHEISMAAQANSSHHDDRINQVIATVNQASSNLHQTIVQVSSEIQQLRTKFDDFASRPDASSNQIIAQISAGQTASRSLSAEPNRMFSYTGTMRISTQINVNACPPLCSCVCHRRKQFKSPDFLRSLLGSLLVDYGGTATSQPCDEKTCRNKVQRRLQLNYKYPEWYWKKIMAFTFINYTVGSGPEILLRHRNFHTTMSEVYNAIANKDLESMKRLFATGQARPDDYLEYYGSILSFTLTRRYYQAAKFLIDQNANPHEIEPYRACLISYVPDTPYTPYQALFLGNFLGFQTVTPEELGLFPLHGDALNDFRFSQIHKCVLGLTDSVSLPDLLSLSTKQIDDVDDIVGATPLFWACARGDLDAVETLLQFGADPRKTSRSCRNYSPLHAVFEWWPWNDALESRRRRPEVVRILLKYSKTYVGNRGSLPCQDGSQSPKFDRSFIDCRDAFGMTPLMLAARAGPVDGATVLLEYGADVNARNNKGNTSLWYAIGNRKPESSNLVGLLLKYGADANATADPYDSPVERAFQRRNFDKLGILTRHGAELLADPVPERDYRPWPLARAVARKDYGRVEHLLKTSGSAGCYDDFRYRTILHVLAGCADIRMLEIFSNADLEGIDVKLKGRKMNCQRMIALEALEALEAMDHSPEWMVAFKKLLDSITPFIAEVSDTDINESDSDDDDGDDNNHHRDSDEELEEEYFDVPEEASGARFTEY